MKIRRWVIVKARIEGWCPSCQAYTNSTPTRTGLPGIVHDTCEKCKVGFQVNHLEDLDDIMDIGEGYGFPPEWGDLMVEQAVSTLT